MSPLLPPGQFSFDWSFVRAKYLLRQRVIESIIGKEINKQIEQGNQGTADWSKGSIGCRIRTVRKHGNKGSIHKHTQMPFLIAHSQKLLGHLVSDKDVDIFCFGITVGSGRIIR
jgi:hypothetical protein